MKHDRHHEVNKYFYEEYARLILNEYNEAFASLDCLDKPDLQNKEYRVGIEVTRAETENECRVMSLIEKVCNEKINLLDFANQIKDKNSKLNRINDMINFFDCNGCDCNQDILGERIQSKIEKLNNNYEIFHNNYLFLFYNKILLPKDMSVINSKFIENEKSLNYDKIFVFTVGTLYIFKENIMKKCKLDEGVLFNLQQIAKNNAILRVEKEQDYSFSK